MYKGLKLMVISLVSVIFLLALIIGSNMTTVSYVSGPPPQNNNTTQWTFWGDAIAEKAPYVYTQDSHGLSIGIQASEAGTWAGFFAKSPNTDANLFHATIQLDFSSISDPNASHGFNTGLYVQTAHPGIIYVFCGATVNKNGYYWSVIQVYGDISHATKFNTLYKVQGGPLTRDCTIITNGDNVLKVFLDDTLVYSSNSQKLLMPAPFNSYLEVETNSAGQMYFGNYTNYYTMTNVDLNATTLPSS